MPETEKYSPGPLGEYTFKNGAGDPAALVRHELSRAAVNACLDIRAAGTDYDEDQIRNEFRKSVISILSLFNNRSDMENQAEMEIALDDAFVIEGGEKISPDDYECLHMTEDMDGLAERLEEARENIVRCAIEHESEDRRLGLECEDPRREYADSMIPWEDCQPKRVSVRDILKRFRIDPNHVVGRALKLGDCKKAVARQHEPLGKRLKRDYEDAAAGKLLRGIPVIIRVSGRFSRDFRKSLGQPFDNALRLAMRATMLGLCGTVQDCAFGYWQGSEISLFLIDCPDSHGPWLSYDIQKLASVSASMAALRFNAAFADAARNRKFAPQAFEACCFNVPESVVADYFRCRRQDAMHSSLCRMAQHRFSAKELRGKQGEELERMLLEQGCDWSRYSIPEKFGVACMRAIDGGFIVDEWRLNEELPQAENGIQEHIGKIMELSLKRDRVHEFTGIPICGNRFP